MGAGFDRGAYGLKQLHCETVAGYIFVCLAAQAPDFSATRAQLSAYLGPHRLAAARVAFESTIIEDGNWKLVWENNRECYHCAGNHPELGAHLPRFTHHHGCQRRRGRSCYRRALAAL
jgi:Rieske 2Fe-2S family protein